MKRSDDYTQALEKALSFMKGYERREISIEEFSEIFPEFKESEDEKMRAMAIKAVYAPEAQSCIKSWGINPDDVIAWLEKQQKPVISYDALREGIAHFGITQYQIDNWLKKYVVVEKQGGQKQEVEDEPNHIDYVFPDNCEIVSKQKLADKVEPKFEIEKGKWYICTLTYVLRGKLVAIKGQIYQSNRDGAIEAENGHLFIDKIDGKAMTYFKPWTIQDAKDGEILATQDHILIFEKLLPKDGGVSYCHYDFGSSTPQFDFNKDDNWYFGKEAKVYPATKEQRDLLFKEMKEAGYEWSEETHELKEIDNEEIDGEDYGIDSLWHAQRILEKTLGEVEGYQSDDGILEHKCAISAVKKLYSQKSIEWSEQDKKMLDDIIMCGECHCYLDVGNITWLKLLKEKIYPQPKRVENNE